MKAAKSVDPRRSEPPSAELAIHSSFQPDGAVFAADAAVSLRPAENAAKAFISSMSRR